MAFPTRVTTWLIALTALAAVGVWLTAKAAEGQFGTPKGTEEFTD